MRKFVFILISFFFLIIFIAGFIFWQGIYLPKCLEGQNIIFSIERGQGLFEVADNLEKEGLIKNNLFFNLYVILKGKQGKIQSGKYELASSMAIPEITQKIVSGQTLKIKITIPEGFTLKQVQNRLSEHNLLKQDIVNFKIGDFQEKFDFLKDAPEEATLEGFLFPDTYFFALDMTDEEVIEIFLANFDRKLTKELRKEIEKQEKTIFEIMIMASLIEKEVREKEDKKLVSGILWKRLEVGMPLQVDAALAYILGEENLTFDQMRRTIALHKNIDSPYNTYKNPSLPPGPISSPGLESILASVYSEDSDYWYYLSTKEGKTIFSKTLQEHNLARARYLY